jgi:signal-transduction protein with cAMP-binding, CBS, and nucleotidyltransferase domain
VAGGVVFRSAWTQSGGERGSLTEARSDPRTAGTSVAWRPFNDFDPVALWDFLTSASYARCPAGRTLLAEGAPSTACYLTINGAVEKVIVRGNRRVRFGLAGPGKAFGYESLIDGHPSPLTAMTRERALLLVLPRDQFERLFNGEDAVARVFLDLIQRDIVAVLRQTLRPLARQAWLLSVSPTAPA